MENENLKIRAFENMNIGGTHYKRALGFTYRLSTDFKSELLIVPGSEEDDRAGHRYGNGHIRMTVRDSFKKNLGDEYPSFAAAWEHYSQREGVIKVKDYIYRDHLR